MAGNEKMIAVVVTDVPNGARCAGMAAEGGELAIGESLAKGNLLERLESILLERSAGEGEGEEGGLSLRIEGEPVDDRLGGVSAGEDRA